MNIVVENANFGFFYTEKVFPIFSSHCNVYYFYEIQQYNTDRKSFEREFIYLLSYYAGTSVSFLKLILLIYVNEKSLYFVAKYFFAV